MAKKKELEDVNNPNELVEDVMARMQKKYGNDMVIVDEDLNVSEVKAIPTGSFGLDSVFGCGGIPRGRMIELFGQESCLSEDTFISYAIRKVDSMKNQNAKGGTIKRLHERFHNLDVGGKGKYKRKQTENSNFYISSINENNAIIKNRIIDVVYCGKKECFEVITESGKKIRCTKEHKFYIGNGNYSPLGDLSVGSEVFIHNNTTLKGRKPTLRYPELFVKYHPTASKKIVNGCTYFRIKRSHAVYEANKNNLSLEDYVNILNLKKKFDLKKLYTIPRNKGLHIHHKNMDHHDDRIENLELLKTEDHNRFHALNNGDKLNFVVVSDIIKSIKKIGKIETYDIKCQSPYNNYVANGIVVHNSGKSTLSHYLIAEVQRQGGRAALIDAEFSYDPRYTSSIGVDTSKLLVTQPLHLEAAMETLRELVDTNAFDIIVVDSVAAMAPMTEIEGDFLKDTMGLQARKLGAALRVLTGSISRSKTIVIFINQLREKIGVIYGKKETTPGGKALKFFASVRLEVSKGEKIVDADDKQIGNFLNITGVKNKVGFPFMKTSVELYYGKGLDLHGDALDYGEKIGVINKTGTTYSFNDTKLGVGRNNAKNFLIKNGDTYEAVLNAIKEEIKCQKESQAK